MIKQKTNHKSSSPKFYVSKQSIRFTNSHIYAKTLSKNAYKQSVLSPDSIQDLSRLISDPAVKTILTGWNSGQGVTICIPESRIFTRVVEIISPVQEMHETVLWQVQNYLPLLPEQMIIDWQIIKEEGLSTTLQVVAAPKKTLEDYVDVLRNHGVKVIDIDTPSMVLCRIISQLALPGLIIDAEEESVLVVSSQKNVIDFVSVVENLNDVPKVATQMMNYYHKKNNSDLPNIYLVGSQAEKISTEIKSNAQIKIIPSPQTAVLDAIASKPVAPPTDSQTINLVPSQYQVDYADASTSSGRKQIFTISAWCLLLLNFISGYFVFLAWQAYSKSVPVSPAAASIQEKSELFAKSQSQISMIINSQDRRNAYNSINAVNSNIPPGITLSNMRFVLSTQSLVLVGISPTQAEILTFKELLDKTKIFRDVKLPLSVYEKREPVPFTITLNIAPQNPTDL